MLRILVISQIDIKKLENETMLTIYKYIAPVLSPYI